jgi:hypothetical protein
MSKLKTQSAVGSSEWRRAKTSEILHAGDRLIYADGLLGGRISEHEIGLRVDESGYFGIARVRKRPNTRRPTPVMSTPLFGLVRYLRRLGHKDAAGMVLRAFKWQQHKPKQWIPPYNQNITFPTKEALRVSAQPFFIADMANGRFDGITDGRPQIFTGDENRPNEIQAEISATPKYKTTTDARPSLRAAPGSEIFVLRMESDSVGWTADAEWAIEWEKQLDGRNWEKVPEIIRALPNDRGHSRREQLIGSGFQRCNDPHCDCCGNSMGAGHRVLRAREYHQHNPRRRRG